MSQRRRVPGMADRIKEAREKLGLTVAQLADQAQIDKKVIYDYELQVTDCTPALASTESLDHRKVSVNR